MVPDALSTHRDLLLKTAAHHVSGLQLNQNYSHCYLCWNLNKTSYTYKQYKQCFWASGWVGPHLLWLWPGCWCGGVTVLLLSPLCCAPSLNPAEMQVLKCKGGFVRSWPILLLEQIWCNCRMAWVKMFIYKKGCAYMILLQGGGKNTVLRDGASLFNVNQQCHWIKSKVSLWLRSQRRQRQKATYCVGFVCTFLMCSYFISK